MLTAHDAYLLGYLPQVIGFHFNGVEVLSRATGAEGALPSRVSAYLGVWPSRGPAVVANVQRVESICRASGLAHPAPPRNTDEYYAWGPAITAAVNQALADHPELQPEARLALYSRKWAFALGEKLGDALHTLDLAAITLALLAAAPGHPFLTQQAKALGEGQARGRDGLHKVVERIELLRALPDTACQLAKRAADAVDGAPVIGPGAGQDATVEAIQRAVREIEGCDIAATLG